MKEFWNEIYALLYDHRGKVAIIGSVLFSTFVHSLPMMIHSKHGFFIWLYSWFYSFCHALSGGLAHPPNGDPSW